MSSPRIAVAVVTYNSEHDIGDFLLAAQAALGEGNEGENIVVVDNCSQDSTTAIVEQTAPRATLIKMTANAGYASGINAAIKGTTADAILIANPDTRIEPDALASLARALGEPGVGIAAPRLVEKDGRLQLSLRRDATVGRILGEALLGGTRANRHARLSQVVGTTSEYERAHDVDWASGALLLVSRACLDATGPWDESLFLYGEEEEFQQRARRHGFSVRYVPDARAVHIGGEMHGAPRLWALGVVNKLRLYARSHSRVATVVFRGALVCNELLRAPTSATHRRALRALCSRDALTPGVRPQ